MKMLKLSMFLLVVLVCQSVLAGETNKVSTNSVAVANASTNIQSKGVEVLKKDPELPGQARMEFTTSITEVPSKQGEDLFAFSIFKKKSGSSIDMIVFSRYPLTSVYPDPDSIGAGFRWNLKFR